MPKTHLNWHNQPACMTITTGKKYQLTNDRPQVTCKSCLKAPVLPDSVNADNAFRTYLDGEKPSMTTWQDFEAGFIAGQNSRG